MEVFITYFSIFRSITEKKEEVLDIPSGKTIEELLKDLAKMYGEKMKDALFKKGRLRKYIIFSINGKIVRKIKSYKLHNGDKLYIIMSITGG